MTCPESSVWQAFLDNSMARAERASAESHLARCAVCRGRLVALADAATEDQLSHAIPAQLRHQAQRLPFDRPGSGSHNNLWTRYVPVAVAAAIVMAIGLSVVLYRSGTRTQETSEFRQSARPAGQLLQTNPPMNAELETGRHEFSWSDAGGPARYEFTITDARGDIVFQQRVPGNSIMLDTQASRLLPRTKYYWTVTATLPDGTRRESGIAEFSLK